MRNGAEGNVEVGVEQVNALKGFYHNVGNEWLLCNQKIVFYCRERENVLSNRVVRLLYVRAPKLVVHHSNEVAAHWRLSDH